MVFPGRLGSTGAESWQSDDTVTGDQPNARGKLGKLSAEEKQR